MDEEQCDGGAIKISASIRAAYMPQIITFSNMQATILDTLRYEHSLTDEKARSVLAGFHFRAADVVKKVGALSGGEKSRLKLCLMMQDNVNFLILDEPTNHLDIATREWIENALDDFEGAMLFVSHDRYLLNKFADKVWSMDGGNIVKYEYGFEEYLDAIRPVAVQKKTDVNKKPVTKAKTQNRGEKPRPVEDLIVEAEAELNKANSAISVNMHNSGTSDMKELYRKKSQLEKRIDKLYDEWLKNN
jgi:ABC-type multidrug transport system ATPase subunit